MTKPKTGKPPGRPRLTSGDKTVRKGFTIPHSQWARALAYIEQKKLSKSEFIRLAIDTYISQA